MTDAPEVAAAIAARKRTLDRQTVMALVGLVAVAVFLNFDSKDHDRTIAGLIDILPWIIGLSIAIFFLNRWTLSIQSKLIRRDFDRAVDASRSEPAMSRRDRHPARPSKPAQRKRN